MPEVNVKRFFPAGLRRAIWRALQSRPIKRALLSRSVQIGQAGQDLWVIGEVFNEKRGGFFVDIGAHDGLELSNTYLLECRYGWDGICIEANPDSFRQLQKNRSVTCVGVCLDSEPGFVEFAKKGMRGGIIRTNCDNTERGSDVIQIATETLDSVLAQHSAPRKIDYISIDVEGAEDRVLRGFDMNSYHVTCLTIERPSEEVRALLARHGLVLIKEIPGLDCFYLHESHVDEWVQNVFSYYYKRHLSFRWR